MCPYSGELVDVELKGSIESMVIKWNTHVDEVLKRDSAAALVGGQSPGPMVGESAIAIDARNTPRFVG